MEKVIAMRSKTIRLNLVRRFAVVALTATALSLHAAAKPNILLILADDLGWSDIGCYGSEIKTPNLDALAADGLKFTRFYNSARCSPTRASILTGLEPHAAGFANLGGKFTPGSVLIPEALAAAGYRTYIVGKWHLGENQSNPVNRGFEEFYGFLGGFNTCWREHPAYALWPKDRTPREYAPGKFYSTDAFRDYALDFIEQGRKPGKPWFLYLAFNAAHFPLHAPEEEIAKYEPYYQRGWDKVREERFARQKQLGVLPANAVLSPRSRIPATKFNVTSGWADKDNPTWDSLPSDRRADLARRMAVYAGMIDRMDQAIGRIVADLRQHDELDNTLIVFLSDNGACAEWNPLGFDGRSGPHSILHAGVDLKKIGTPDSYVSYGSAWANACDTPWRLYKHYCHEGGIRTPFIVHWPAGLQTTPGSMTAQPGHITDLMPTFLELAGASYPKEFKGNAAKPLVGTSLVPVFSGKNLSPRPLCFEHEGNRAVMQGRWKLVALNREPWELYDTAADPVELKNVAAAHADVVERLAAEWKKWAAANNVPPAPPKAGQAGETGLTHD